MRYLTIALGLGLLVSACGGSDTSPTAVAVTGVSPGNGTTLGGTTVTITGSNFAAGATVTIGGVPATAVSFNSPTSISATTPQHAAGAVDVAVALTNGQRGSLGGAYTYVAPQQTANPPPVIASIVVQGSVGPREPAQFASLDETVAVTATVTDAETPPSQLTYDWSTNAGGAFTGSGSRVSWTAPHAFATPGTATLTLTVIERYQTTDDTGLPVTKENRTTGTTPVRVHDSIKEVNDMAVDFLVGFSQQLDPSYVVRNFTPTCDGTAAEYNDVLKNNQQNTITSYSIGTPATTINFIGSHGCPFRGVFGDACAQVPVDWHATNKTTGIAGEAKGIDQVTAVFDNAADRWWLCASDFNSSSLTSFVSRFLVIH